MRMGRKVKYWSLIFGLASVLVTFYYIPILQCQKPSSDFSLDGCPRTPQGLLFYIVVCLSQFYAHPKDGSQFPLSLILHLISSGQCFCKSNMLSQVITDITPYFHVSALDFFSLECNFASTPHTLDIILELYNHEDGPGYSCPGLS